MAEQKRQGEDDGVVTSAPAAKAGNLLGDLLASAKQDMAREAQSRETASEKRAREERENREREAALKRAQAQESLNEAARKRNEQIAIAEREARAVSDQAGAPISSKTAQHQRPQPLAEPIAESVSEPRVIQKPVNRLLLAALVLIGVGVGFGSAFALIPTEQRSDVDVGGAARALVAATSKAAAETEKRILESANKQIDELKRQYAEVQAEQKKLAADLEQARKDLELAREEMAKKPQETRPAVRRTGNGGSSVPSLRPGIY
jgi:hypothetical protein